LNAGRFRLHEFGRRLLQKSDSPATMDDGTVYGDWKAPETDGADAEDES